ncbi:hypothetical protein G9P44_000350 [Scheffersomyces stipitis]|nr:hypothetical protein G9P44_000350 [Scheffersomyces stipitis]
MSHSRTDSITSSIASTSHNHPQKIGPWKLGKTLGRGATGRVLLATHQTTGQKAAVKVVSKSELHDEDQPVRKNSDDAGLPYGIEREIIIMKLLTHPNVLRLYDVWETSKALYLVLEYVEGGELFDLLVERGPLQEVEAIKYFRQIILGTAYCHALGICHRDLKPENLLLDAALNVKLADFGMAALESNGKLLETSCGSPHYAAPEIVSGLKYHGAASDVWSCGVILFALLTGRLPFDDENIRNLLLKVQAGNFDMPDEISPEAQDLIGRMLTVDPIKRIPTEKVLNHALLTKYPIPNEDLISVKSLPHPETAYKSLGSAKNIDKQILSNLSILWHDRPQQEIINCLLKNGPNPEKTFYALLLRYRHNSDDASSGSPKKSASFNAKRGMVRNSSFRNTPKKGQGISVSRPTSFQYRNNNRNSVLTTNGKISASSSVNNSPHKRFSYGYSPSRSPRKYNQQEGRIPAVPKNIYNEIVAAQREGAQRESSYSSMPPSLPSKDSYLVNKPHQLQPQSQSQPHPQGKEIPVVDEVSDLIPSAKISPNKRSSMVNRSASKRMSKRKSMRASMTSGLKRNSITMKLLSTYAKLSGDSEWEYVDKQAKRTSATFATLCDKIFNQEEYNPEDELLIDEEEKQAKEYERLMEIERKKHEAELKARKELEKKRKRQKRKSLLSSKKLSILIRDDNAANNSEIDIVDNSSDIRPTKRQSKNLSALRSLSEGANEDSDDLTYKELEELKRRSVTQPTQRRKQTPILTRRPVSRLDPLWQAYENDELDRAQSTLEAEWRESNLKKSASKKNRESMVHKNRRESVISVIEDSRKWEQKQEFELPEPDKDTTDLSEEYMSEIRKSKLLNSQLNLKGNLKSREDSGPKTLIGNVKIPNVTRKSRNFTNSNKRLSVLSMYSTKESYHDLKSFVNNEEDEYSSKKTTLRTSFADRLDKAGLGEADEDDHDFDQGSIMDFDEHLSNKRYSYHDSKRLSKMGETGARPTSKIPNLPTENDYDDTFVTKDDQVHRSSRRYSNKSSKPLSEDDTENEVDVFDKIKLPEGKSSKSSIDMLAEESQQSQNQKPAHIVKPMVPSAESMLIPHVNNLPDDSQTQTYPRVRPSKNDKQTDTIPPTPPMHKNRNSKKPLEDSTNKPDVQQKRNRSIFRKLSWGSKKVLENDQLPTPGDSRVASAAEKEKPRSSSFFRWFSSSSSSSDSPKDSDLKRFKTILPKQEMDTALFALLNSWSNFGLKNLRNDQVGYNITGAISSNNSFNLKSCKFRIKINAREFNQKSEIVCARVKGSRNTTETLFKEIEKVLRKEGVMDE